MPMDGWTLGYMACELESRLRGGKIDRILQPERDEIHIVIRNHGENHRLMLSASANHARVQCTAEVKPGPDTPPMLCQLMRKHLLGGRVGGIEQPGGDRILRIAVDSHTELGDPAVFTIVCEIMGRHSNILLVGPDGVILDSAHHVGPDMSRVRIVMPGLRYTEAPAQDKLLLGALTPEALHARLIAFPEQTLFKALANTVVGLSPTAAQELCARAAGADAEARVASVDELPVIAGILCGLMQKPPPADPRLLLRDDGVPADFTPFAYKTRAEVPQRTTATLSEAMDRFYRERDRAERMSQRTSALENTLKNSLARARRKLAAQLQDIENAKSIETYRESGDLLAAILHDPPPPGAKEVSVTNWFAEDQARTVIRLDPALDLRANMQRYYKLYRKAKSASVMAAEQAEKSRAEIELLEDALQSLSVCQTEADIDELREQLAATRHLRATHNRKRKKPAQAQPMRFVSSEGHPIEVGKTAAQNERLLASAQGDDLWLHAKDMPGSHVLVRLDGAQASETVIREAALLAALYSKGSSSSSVPVDRTLRKHVKKPSGARPGFVIYTHQNTMYVTPDAGIAERLQG